MMSRVALLLPLIAAAAAAPEARFSCEECVREMHGLAAMVKMEAIPIHDYIRDNYCPTLDSTAAQHFCEDSLSKYYVGMLFAVVEHYFVDGALHVCQTSGTCSAREYTSPGCTRWPWRSSSSPQRSACRNQSAEAAQPSHQSQLTAPMLRYFSAVLSHK